jgi:hypothetical protein
MDDGGIGEEGADDHGDAAGEAFEGVDVEGSSGSSP